MRTRVVPLQRATPTKLTAEALASALRELHGNRSACARKFGVTRQAVQDFIRRRPSLRAVADECRQTLIDHIESAIYQAALAGDTRAQTFLLRCLGRARGWSEKVEVSGHSGGTLTITYISNWREFGEPPPAPPDPEWRN